MSDTAPNFVVHRNSRVVDVFHVGRHVRTKLFALASTALLMSAARAEDPSPAAQQVTAKVLEWVTSPNPVSGLRFATTATSITLDRATKSDAASMAGRLAGARLIATAVYDGKPATMAGDLSQQLRLVEDIPPEKLQPLLVEGARVAKADTVASNWAMDLLGARDTDVITAAVFWFADERGHSLLNGMTPEPRLVLVLFRSVRNSAGDLEIAQIAWGAVGDSK